MKGRPMRSCDSARRPRAANALRVPVDPGHTSDSERRIGTGVENECRNTLVFDPSPILKLGPGLAFDSDPGSVLDYDFCRPFVSDSAMNHSSDFKEAGVCIQNCALAGGPIRRREPRRSLRYDRESVFRAHEVKYAKCMATPARLKCMQLIYAGGCAIYKLRRNWCIRRSYAPTAIYEALL
ncbi:hypothetical protein EVAR_47775_1 [Eumeta japonica]|uniref:Uncharacterized protein n=1 Tax=Eumeta variegata TaxID=151549 RepID=A0A4C1XX38_EUMVA|nr:hypothetical protein EVAR_47775_1 [Eumeta japonica]